ncbi:MAG: nucleotide exchange factor GrpE [Myxococcota bacterium]
MSEEQRRNALHDAMAEALESVEKRERESQNARPRASRSAEAGDPRSGAETGEEQDEDEHGNPVASSEAEAPVPEAAEPDVNDRLLRLAADFDNYRVGLRRYRAQQVVDDGEQVAQQVLDPESSGLVVDNLLRAIAAETDAVADADEASKNPLLEGIRMVHKQFSDVLDQHGVRGFDSVGTVFDPELHEALSQAPSDEHEPGSVIAEHERGYMIHDRLLRPARVVVAMPQAEEASPDEKKSEESDPSDPLESDDG